MRFVVYPIAALFVVIILWAQNSCSLIPSIGHQCNGPEGDAWMLPFMLAPVGIPALIYSVVLYLR